MKAAPHLKNDSTTYGQSFKVLRDYSHRRWEAGDVSFQMILPYLDKFVELNPGSTARCDTEELYTKRLFVCPSIIKTSLRHMRPIMSLDAAHLKSKWKGTLYTASVKTGSDNIYPVAMAIMNGNENEAGWTWFLELLHDLLEILVMDHPKPGIRYKYFTFISDRQKGLIEALKNVFPNNHTCFCAIHIARNAEQKCGKRVARFVHKLSTTFSHVVSSDLIERVNKASQKGRQYLEEIQANQWRSTSWRDDDGLPPRYGIVTSNISEATNNMFREAREGSWLYALDYMLGKVTERISTLRKEVSEKDGVVERLVDKLQQGWNTCAGFKVLELERAGWE